jgi:hypothetical protein
MTFDDAQTCTGKIMSGSYTNLYCISHSGEVAVIPVPGTS